jgi:hypothetical protein
MLSFAANTKNPASLVGKPGLMLRLDRNHRWLRESDLNQRPSGYEPDELPGCSIPRHSAGCFTQRKVFYEECFGRPGGDRLSHVLRRSIIGAGGFHGRVRDGIGCRLPAMATRSSKALSVRSRSSNWKAGSGILAKGAAERRLCVPCFYAWCVLSLARQNCH